MEFEEIKELIKLIQKSKISELKYEDEKSKLSIRTKSYSANKEVILQPSVQQMPMQQQQQIQQHPANVGTPVQDAPTENAADDTSKYLEIKSPMVGTFYRSPSPEKGPFIKVGDVINVDDTICLVEAMKLFNEVKAEIGGKIVKVLVEDASPIEYDQVLFLVEPV
jgi:acetyl-CoA carboxylase biotin carboxyl carrier protein